jgi:Putative Flp pilus-assembly TadE/G-like
VSGLGGTRHRALAARGEASSRRDDGGVIILVAILVAAGMVSGLLAMVADVGQLYAERRVVQNSADAASLAIAQRSAELDEGALDVQESETLAGQLANANSPDAATEVIDVCGTDGLGACPPAAGLTDCQPLPEGTEHAVQVRTATLRPDGSTFLTPFFAGLMSDQGTVAMEAGACAQAAWGPAASAAITFPMLLPLCPGQPNGSPVWIADFDPSDPDFTPRDACVVDGTSFVGLTKGFAFGAFEGVPKTCVDPVEVEIGDVIDVETSVTQWCGSDVRVILDDLVADGVPVLVPVVGAHANNGQGQYAFTVEGFRSLTLLGYKVKNRTGGTAPSPAWQGTPCHRSAKRSCLYGSFAPAVIPGGVGDGVDLGVRAVVLVP